MKKNFLLMVCICLCSLISVHAQEGMPQAIHYQAVARDVTGKVLSEKRIGVKVEILKGAANGTTVFTETHVPTSTKAGTINLLIGQGTAITGTFANIDWASGIYYLQLSMDIKGGGNYEIVSTTQMLPVPYALYAAKAGTVENEGGSESSMAKFVLMAEDDAEELAAVLNGETINLNFGNFGIDISLIYLDGTNQELNIVIAGLPTGAIEGDSYNEKKTLPSTSMGRFCYIGAYNIPQGTHNLKMNVIDKQGTILKEYPFTLVVTPRVN